MENEGKKCGKWTDNRLGRGDVIKEILKMAASAGGFVLDTIETVYESRPSRQILPPMPFDNNSKYLNAKLKDLERRDILESTRENKVTKYHLTEAGAKLLARYELADTTPGVSEKWDGIWRIVSFDIKETKRSVREMLRRELSMVGFKKLQNSVWIIPYECREYIKLLKTGLGLNKDLLCFTTKNIEGAEWLKGHFGLI